MRANQDSTVLSLCDTMLVTVHECEECNTLAPSWTSIDVTSSNTRQLSCFRYEGVYCSDCIQFFSSHEREKTLIKVYAHTHTHTCCYTVAYSLSLPLTQLTSDWFSKFSDIYSEIKGIISMMSIQ